MALEGMHHELLSHLKAKGATQSLVDAWESAWYSALACPGGPLPCPQCFLDGRESMLEPRPSYRNIGQARCQICHTVFMFSGG